METKKITLKKVTDAFHALTSIGNQVIGTQPDGKPILKKYNLDILWPLDDIKDALEKNFNRHRDEVIELAKELGDPHPQRFGSYQVRKDNLTTYADRLKVLDETEVTINFNSIKYEFLLENGVTMSDDELRPLKNIFIVKSGEKKKPKKE